MSNACRSLAGTSAAISTVAGGIAATAGDAGLLTGVTKYCTHPASLAAERIGGTKNPDVERIIAIRPDVVLANEEENREPDLTALRAAGLTPLAPPFAVRTGWTVELADPWGNVRSAPAKTTSTAKHKNQP